MKALETGVVKKRRLHIATQCFRLLQSITSTSSTSLKLRHPDLEFHFYTRWKKIISSHAWRPTASFFPLVSQRPFSKLLSLSFTADINCKAFFFKKKVFLRNPLFYSSFKRNITLSCSSMLMHTYANAHIHTEQEREGG